MAEPVANVDRNIFDMGFDIEMKTLHRMGTTLELFGASLYSWSVVHSDDVLVFALVVVTVYYLLSFWIRR